MILFFFIQTLLSSFNIPVSHLKASSNPLPVLAIVLKIAHCLFFISLNPIFSDISISLNTPSISCLLANIAIGTPLSSSSCKSKNNSCFAISILSLSEESITNTTAFVLG